ncbi:hypothetical protein QVG61_07545 [Thiohalobacter sp. IOR34]|uniref:hypothetical protein n=1 Tax=Thiohalobacter sp. IOR34 TaxID=3057176 RepID=UPI0025AFC51E|nr:hypothetical protein [Thiohalobacter sp. IOR34]WJW74371.1 hypothetical protein QVG61_07545 [Thiohalobacter sp. IOR34]
MIQTIRRRTDCLHRSLAVAVLCLACASVQAGEGGATTALWAAPAIAQPAFRLGPGDTRRGAALDLFAIQPRESNFAAGLSRRLDARWSLDAGVAVSRVSQVRPVNYHDYFLAVNYGSLSGRLWYLDDAENLAGRSLYYEAGWEGAVTDRLSLSLRMGQRHQPGQVGELLPDFSIGARTRVRGFGLDLRLVERGLPGTSENSDLRLMGSLSRSFP